MPSSLVDGLGLRLNDPMNWALYGAGGLYGAAFADYFSRPGSVSWIPGWLNAFLGLIFLAFGATAVTVAVVLSWKRNDRRGLWGSFLAFVTGATMFGVVQHEPGSFYQASLGVFVSLLLALAAYSAPAVPYGLASGPGAKKARRGVRLRLREAANYLREGRSVAPIIPSLTMYLDALETQLKISRAGRAEILALVEVTRVMDKARGGQRVQEDFTGLDSVLGEKIARVFSGLNEARVFGKGHIGGRVDVEVVAYGEAMSLLGKQIDLVRADFAVFPPDGKMRRFLRWVAPTVGRAVFYLVGIAVTVVVTWYITTKFHLYP